MFKLVITLVVVGVAAVAVAILARRREESASAGQRDEGGTLPYEKRRFLLTKAEKSFYLVLRQVVPQDHVLFAKVRLADVLDVRKGTEQRQGHRNAIIAKHFDFVVCDQQWLEPRVAIELDDATHGRADRQNRDSFLDRATAAAGLPLMRIPARATYDLRVLRAELESRLRG